MVAGVVAPGPVGGWMAEVTSSEPHAIRLTRGIHVLETRILRRTWRSGPTGFRRLVGELSRDLRAVVYDPHQLDAWDRAVIHALDLASDRDR